MKFTINQERAGDMAVRSMSDKAQKFYNGADPLKVYEYRVYEGDSDIQVKRYAYTGAFGEADGLTEDELEAFLEANYIDDEEKD